MLKEINFIVNGMYCVSCENLIQSELYDCAGVKKATVDHETGESTVIYEEAKISFRDLENVVSGLGYEVENSLRKNPLNKNGSSKAVIIGVIAAVVLLGGLSFALSGDRGVSPEMVKNTNVPAKTVNDGFVGERGASVKAVGGIININEASVNDGNLHAFNYFSESKNKNVYFFVVRADDGTYRVAANACEVCFGAKKGFVQLGDLIRCENCRVSYTKNTIAVDKGGCNPGPIDSDAKVVFGQLEINVDDVEAVAYLF